MHAQEPKVSKYSPSCFAMKMLAILLDASQSDWTQAGSRHHSGGDLRCAGGFVERVQTGYAWQLEGL